MSDLKRPDETVLKAAHRAAVDSIPDHLHSYERDVERAVDEAIRVVVSDLQAMLFPEKYPGYDPDHVHWSSDQEPWPIYDSTTHTVTYTPPVFMWTADTIEWVAQWCDHRLRELEPGDTL
jgi:hypothetical protein